MKYDVYDNMKKKRDIKKFMIRISMKSYCKFFIIINSEFSKIILSHDNVLIIFLWIRNTK